MFAFKNFNKKLTNLKIFQGKEVIDKRNRNGRCFFLLYRPLLSLVRVVRIHSRGVHIIDSR